MDLPQVRELYDGLDALDAHSFAQAFMPDGWLTLGNGPAAQGRDAIERSLRALFALLEGMRHELVASWPIEDGWVIEARVQYQVRGGSEAIVIPCAHVLRSAAQGLSEVRMYQDVSPLFAAAQAARVPEQGAPDALDIRHREQGHRGAFEIEREGSALAELTYSRADEHTVLLDHTFVSDALRGKRVGRKLLDAAVQWARATQTKLIPVCSYARAEFARDSSLADVLG